MAQSLEPLQKPAAKPEPKRAAVATQPRKRSARKVAGKRPSSGLVRVISGVLTLAMMIFIGLGTGALWYSTTVEQPGPLETAKAFSVRKDEATDSVAQRLESEGIVASARSFMLHYRMRWVGARFGGKPVLIKAGDYEIQPQASLTEVMDVLGEGRTVLARITIPEGLTSWRIVELVKADRNLEGEVTVVPPEGALLPDTYKFTRGMQRQAFLDLMAQKSREVLEQAWAAREPGLPLKSPEEALILASIVEKESGRRDERARVAGVFVNRLRKPMRLQSDPTIRYGLAGGQSNWSQPFYKSEIQQKTAYNTYQIDGLPPTPICNPGRASIQAVMKPAKSNELYFVADGKGGHVFSATLKEHEAAVQVWRKVEREIRAREAQRAQAKAAASAAAAAPVPSAQALPVPSAGPGVTEGDPELEAEPQPQSQPTAAAPQSPPVASGAATPKPGVAIAVVPVPTQPVPPPSPAATVPAPASSVAQPANTATEPAIPLPVRKPKRS
jgi:UPF0755 protein